MITPTVLHSKEKYMDISANGNTIGKFLSNAGEELFIPRYQRPYSWNKENLKELISDIEN